jgi:hypothetical protein
MGSPRDQQTYTPHMTGPHPSQKGGAAGPATATLSPSVCGCPTGHSGGDCSAVCVGRSRGASRKFISLRKTSNKWSHESISLRKDFKWNRESISLRKTLKKYLRKP